MKDSRAKAEKIFMAGIHSVLPSVLIPGSVRLEGDSLSFTGFKLSLGDFDNIYVIGAGKASGLMASEIEKILGNRVTGGFVVVKYGYSCKLNKIKISEAGHPVPDTNSFKSTETILKIAGAAGDGDLVICLISGGGSALLADYPAGSSPEEMMKLNDLLVNSGASISEINAVRKHVSRIKGGQLAKAVYPATLVSLILSDVPGDPLEVIASGPTSPDPTTFTQALGVLSEHNILDACPASLVKYLQDGSTGINPETPDEKSPVFSKTHNILIGTNKTALEAARLKALEFNINAVIVDSDLQGDVASVADFLVETAIQFQANEHEVKPVCLLFGGETTIRMSGEGKGGRNQHLALIASTLLKDHPGITILAGGTDGNDGPTNAAGAVIDSETWLYADRKDVEPEKYIKEFDSYHFFKKTGGHIITGPTMTNVMDIIVVIIE